MVPSPANYSPKASQSGLTLIEVLIALAIVGIAMTAVIKAASQHIRSVTYLQNKTMAMWVGQQVLNEQRAGLLNMGESSGNQKLMTTLFGHDWYWQVKDDETANPHINKVMVKVFANENAEEEDVPLITLESYRYHEK